MKSFNGKVAAITGAGSGIGRALALSLAESGCELALSDIDPKSVEETAQMAAPHGGRVTTATVDVAVRDSVHAWADTVAREHGRVNVIFNNAGVALAGTLEGISYEDFEWIMNINFWGVVHGTKAFLPHLRASGEGHIVNISSVFGLVAVPGNGAYNATKFAVRGFTEALRQELEMMNANVSATCVHPGGIQTNIARSSRVTESVAQLLNGQGAATADAMEKLFITSPMRAAKTILRAVQRNQRRVLVGPDALVIDALVRLMPTKSQDLTKALARHLVR